MKLVSYDGGDGARVGILHRDGVVDARAAMAAGLAAERLPNPPLVATAMVPSDMTELLRQGVEPLQSATPDAAIWLPLDDVRLLAPVPHPGKVIGVGRNYRAHAAEGGLEPQAEPRLFFKANSAIAGPGAAIARPNGVTKPDWEVELAVVVGRAMRDVPVEAALAHVAGYTILNDLSAREFQFDVKPPQTSFAKSMDGFCPMGPCLVTADAIPDPGDLDLRCWVNDALMQVGNTQDLIFSVPYILSYASRYMTLQPGDVIATGTPDGVGAFRKPPVYLQPGDRVRMEIPPIGVLENRIC